MKSSLSKEVVSDEEEMSLAYVCTYVRMYTFVTSEVGLTEGVVLPEGGLSKEVHTYLRIILYVHKYTPKICTLYVCTYPVCSTQRYTIYTLNYVVRSVYFIHAHVHMFQAMFHYNHIIM